VLAALGTGPNADEETFKVVDAETFSGSASAGVHTLAVSGFQAAPGDMFGFSGIGPYYSQFTSDNILGSDATYMSSSSSNPFLATPPGGPGTTFTAGLYGDPDTTYDYVSDYFDNQGRNYGIGVNVSPVPDRCATATLAAPLLAGLLAMKGSRKVALAGPLSKKA
jgi:hypothetical protein